MRFELRRLAQSADIKLVIVAIVLSVALSVYSDSTSLLQIDVLQDGSLSSDGAASTLVIGFAGGKALEGSLPCDSSSLAGMSALFSTVFWFPFCMALTAFACLSDRSSVNRDVSKARGLNDFSLYLYPAAVRSLFYGLAYCLASMVSYILALVRFDSSFFSGSIASVLVAILLNGAMLFVVCLEVDSMCEISRRPVISAGVLLIIYMYSLQTYPATLQGWSPDSLLLYVTPAPFIMHTCMLSHAEMGVLRCSAYLVIIPFLSMVFVAGVQAVRRAIQ